MGELGDGEHEHEVEEQLDIGDAAAVLPAPLAQQTVISARHAWSHPPYLSLAASPPTAALGMGRPLAQADRSGRTGTGQGRRQRDRHGLRADDAFGMHAPPPHLAPFVGDLDQCLERNQQEQASENAAADAERQARSPPAP